jgi:4-amino-4-deoxy-L-arabinose transferase-like glycosyltransferase
MAFGEDDFWVNSYSAFYRLAQNFVAGKGLCFGSICAWWPPLYPLFLTVPAFVGKHYLLIVIPEALMGAGTALCAFLIGRQLFNVRAGLVACAITAFYPYYAVHDTALQETGMVTFCMALSVWLLFRADKLARNRDWFVAGISLGTVALVRASVAPAIGVALIWIAIWGQGEISRRMRECAILSFAVLLMVTPWLIYTYHVTGSPVLSSQTGRALWIGNNSETFSHYPAESMDLSTGEAWSKMPPADKDEATRLANDEIGLSNWYARRAFKYMRENPGAVLRGALRKLEAAFSWRLNPHREPLAQAAYAIGYIPVAVFGIVGMFLNWRRREVMLIALLYLAFIAVSAVFLAHTSHRTYLDVYWIVFAAFTIEYLRAWLTPQRVLRSNSSSRQLL